MVNTRVQASTPVIDATSYNNDPIVCIRMEEYLDPYVQALAARMDDMSKAVQTLCSKMDKLLKGVPSKASQTMTSQNRGKGKKSSGKLASQHMGLRTQVSSNSRVP
ncbi:hypothetical protein Nepgr_021586 [Nepenthes gracilis]|uniref:Uncharacterized protein n=1 Tax=Nepenthes gracilis TaxID=150966 RepID=A0AAD3SXR3_NEPGR|nr:hypothetical protein Nepgr_021586 [Nepenthes gracilis]